MHKLRYLMNYLIIWYLDVLKWFNYHTPPRVVSFLSWSILCVHVHKLLFLWCLSSSSGRFTSCWGVRNGYLVLNATQMSLECSFCKGKDFEWIDHCCASLSIKKCLAHNRDSIDKCPINIVYASISWDDHWSYWFSIIDVQITILF